MEIMTDELLFRYFQCNTTPEEEKIIKEWYKAGEENRKRFSDTHDFYETLLMNSTSGALDGSDVRKITAKRRRRLLTAGAVLANIAAIAVIFIMAVYVVPMMGSRSSDAFTSIEIPAGQRMNITLCDGTRVNLNSGAVLTYPNIFDRKTREVSLSGEAYFDVAHNAEQPFVVKTFASDIEVLGTEFNVRAYGQAGIFSTTLVEGSVRLTDVSDSGRTIVLKPAQTAFLADGRLNVENRPVGREIRWLEGIIDIGGLDFPELVEKLEKAYGVNIIIERDTMPELEYIACELRISDGIDYALDILRNVSDFTYVKDARTGDIHIR